VIRKACGCLVLALSLATPAVAQDRADSPSPATQPNNLRTFNPPFGFRGYVHFDEVWMTSSQSFNAVLGTASLTEGGVALDMLNLWKRVFVRAGVARMGGLGTRVFVADGEVIPLGVPIRVRLRTAEFGTGWRFVHPRLPRYTFYGGASLLRVRYAEESDFAREDEDASEGFWGRAVFGGVEVPAWKWLVAGAEVQYRSVPHALGDAGVSAVFNETGLGGFAIRGLIGIKR
jgi:hypothetical protein